MKIKKVVPLRHNLFNFIETFDYLFWHNLCVNLGCLNVCVAKHFRHDFHREAGTEGDGGGKGMSANVGSEVFAYLGFLFYQLQLAGVGYEACFR